MKKESFIILMHAIHANGQLTIPKGLSINEWSERAFDSALNIGQTLPIDNVIDCKHENEKMHQGNGFVYVTCDECGEDL